MNPIQLNAHPILASEEGQDEPFSDDDDSEDEQENNPPSSEDEVEDVKISPQKTSPPIVRPTVKGNIAPLEEKTSAMDDITPAKAKSGLLIDGEIKFKNCADCKCEVLCCRYSNDGKFLAVGLSDGSVKVYEANNLQCVYILRQPSATLPVTCIRWRPDEDTQQVGNVLVVTYASSEVRMWHVTTGTSTMWQTAHPSRQALSLDYSASGARFAVGGCEGKIHLFDARNASAEPMVFEPSTKTDEMSGHTMRVFSLQFHPDHDDLFLSAGWDNTVHWWDARASRHSVRKITGPHVCGDGLDIEPSTLEIVTASWRRDHDNIQCWDFGSGRLVKQLQAGDTRSLYYCVQWKTKDSIVVGGSHDNVVRTYDTKCLPNRTILHTASADQVSGFPGAVCSIDQRQVNKVTTIAASSGKAMFTFELPLTN